MQRIQWSLSEIEGEIILAVSIAAAYPETLISESQDSYRNLRLGACLARAAISATTNESHTFQTSIVDASKYIRMEHCALESDKPLQARRGGGTGRPSPQFRTRLVEIWVKSELERHQTVQTRALRRAVTTEFSSIMNILYRLDKTRVPNIRRW